MPIEKTVEDPDEGYDLNDAGALGISKY